MVLVDSSVWIDWFCKATTPQTDRLVHLHSSNVELLIGDLVLTEVLQGFRSDLDFQRARTKFDELETLTIGGRHIAISAARNFRHLRQLGITVRKTIDTLIATRCIEDGIPLLYSDKDFEPFRVHLGLVSAMDT